jgi:MFS family permease
MFHSLYRVQFCAKVGGYMSKKIVLFCLITGLFWFSLYIYVPIVPTYAVDLGANMFFVGMITGSYGLMQMLLRIPLGIVSDKMGARKPFIIGGIAFAALAGVPLCLVQSSPSLFVCRLLGGIAAAAWVPFSVHFSLYFKSEEGPKVMGIINAVNSTGQVLAVVLCGMIAGRAGHVTVFAVATIVGLLALVLSFFIKENGKVKTEPLNMKELARVPFEGHLVLISLLGLLSQYMAFATLYGFTPIIAKNLKASDFQVSMLLTLFILPAIVSSAISGPLYKKFGGRLMLSVSFILFALDCLLTPFATSVTQLFIITVVGGFAQGLIFPMLMGYVVRSISAGKRNTAMGFYQAVYGLGMFLGPVIVGVFSNNIGILWGFVFTSLVGFAGAGLSWKIKSENTSVETTVTLKK